MCFRGKSFPNGSLHTLISVSIKNLWRRASCIRAPCLAVKQVDSFGPRSHGVGGEPEVPGEIRAGGGPIQNPGAPVMGVCPGGAGRGGRNRGAEADRQGNEGGPRRQDSWSRCLSPPSAHWLWTEHGKWARARCRRWAGGMGPGMGDTVLFSPERQLWGGCSRPGTCTHPE